MVRSGFQASYRRLLSAYGAQHWWPAETPFEVMVGAVLTQNTAWGNVEQAIAGLKQVLELTPERLLTLTEQQLAGYIRPSGYFNVKARRLRNLCQFIVQQGGESALRLQPTDRLRDALLSVNGVGPETADDILLYAFERPVFVIDAYTRRLFSRLGLIEGSERYEQLRQGVEAEFGPDVEAFNEFHALIVRHAKRHCAVRPRCEGCCIRCSCISVKPTPGQ